MDINAAEFTRVKSTLDDRKWRIQHLKPKIGILNF